MDDHQLLRYSRHILLEEIGIERQEKWLHATAAVIGCGGLASAALPYLAAAGIGRLLIADHDLIDSTNLQRQICYTEADIGRPKAEAMAAYLHRLNPACQVEPHTTRLAGQALSDFVAQADIVLDCCDNFATRQAVNAACVQHRKPLVSGAAVRFDGQLAVYRADLGGQEPCYTCLFDAEEANDGACALFGVFSPLVGIIGSLQAAEALKVLAGLPAESGILRCYNALTGSWQAFRFGKNTACRVCGTPASR